MIKRTWTVGSGPLDAAAPETIQRTDRTAYHVLHCQPGVTWPSKEILVKQCIHAHDAARMMVDSTVAWL